MTIIRSPLLTRSIIILFLLAFALIAAFPVLAVDSTGTGKIKRDEVRQKVEEKRQIAQQRLETTRSEVASRAAALREKLQNFKNKIKANLVEKISNVLNRINQNQTTQMQKHLDKMSSMVTRLENRVNEATAGANTASASAAVNNAEAAVASASTAVANQAKMDYTLNISTESAARADTKAARDKLRDDLMSVRRLVIEAKQAVANAIRTVAQSLGGIKSGQ